MFSFLSELRACVWVCVSEEGTLVLIIRQCIAFEYNTSLGNVRGGFPSHFERVNIHVSYCDVFVDGFSLTVRLFESHTNRTLGINTL